MTGPSAIRFQLLGHMVEISAADAQVRSHLSYLVQDADHGAPPHARVRYEVTPSGGGMFSVREDGREIGDGLGAVDVLHRIYTAAHQIALDGMPPHLRIHAASATIAGKRVLIAGGRRAGKTTLILRLLFDGVEVHGDESVLVPAQIPPLPLPRRFHIRKSSLPLISELGALHAGLPKAEGRNGEIFGFAPSDAGRGWTVTPAQVDAVVFLAGSHGQPTSIRPLTKKGMLQRLRNQTTFPERSITWFNTLLKLVDSAEGYLLYNGDPSQSSSILRGLFQPHGSMKGINT
jgi:hypothetical protein